MRISMAVVALAMLVSFSVSAATEHKLGTKNTIVRAEKGDIGMFFKFGGLATMGVAGHNPVAFVAPAAFGFSEVGAKFVLSEKWMIPVSIGLGLNHIKPENTDGRTSWGLSATVGFEYHFRIWRRISPYLGGRLNIQVVDPTGKNNLTGHLNLGGVAGVEYYVADRVSLSAEFMINFNMAFTKNPTADIKFFSSAGGALTVTFYF